MNKKLPQAIPLFLTFLITFVVVLFSVITVKAFSIDPHSGIFLVNHISVISLILVLILTIITYIFLVRKYINIKSKKKFVMLLVGMIFFNIIFLSLGRDQINDLISVFFKSQTLKYFLIYLGISFFVTISFSIVLKIKKTLIPTLLVFSLFTSLIVMVYFNFYLVLNKSNNIVEENIEKCGRRSCHGLDQIPKVLNF